MTLDDLTVSFSHLDRGCLLDDWLWLIGKDKIPILLTAAGDAFLQDKTDGAIYFLETGEGRLERISESLEKFEVMLQDKSFVVDYFAVEMIGDLIQANSRLANGQIYSLIKPAILGGEYQLENISQVDIEVHFSVNGQIHHRVHELPEGTAVDTVKIG